MEVFGLFLALGIYFAVDMWKDVRMRELELQERKLRMEERVFWGEAAAREIVKDALL